MTTKSIGLYSAPAAIRLPELASERRPSSRPSWLSVDFNDLINNGEPQPIPRRYEETRQFAVQDFTHHRILKVGHDVHHRLAEEAQSRQDEALKEREAAVRAECDRQTEKRLAELESQLAMQHEFRINRLKQEHERIVQERVLETETAMRKEMLEAVEKEREEAKRALKEKEEELNAWWTEEAKRQVQAAREEEHEEAAKERKRLQQQHQREKQLLLEEQTRLREQAVRDKEEEKDKEMLAELLKFREEAERVRQLEAEQASERQRQLQAAFDQRELELLAELDDAEAVNQATRAKQAAAEEELIRLYREFEIFVDRVLRLNTAGGGSFLLPNTEFLQAVMDRNEQEEQEDQDEDEQLELRRSRPNSAGTVRLQRATLPSNVQLVSEFD